MERTLPAVVHECAGCGHVMQVPGRYAGSEQRCRRCGAPFVVAGAAAQPAAEEEPPPESRRRIAPGCAAAAVLCAVVIGGAWLLRPVLGPPPSATDLVRESLLPTVMPVKWSQAPLEGGTAVVLNDLAAFWVHEGVVYACDGNAREWSPGARQAPPQIDELAVRRAVLNPDLPPADLR